VLLGRNGVGKTTLLKSLMGLVPIKSGTISWNGKPIQGMTPYERARSGIGYVPQGREIFGRLTVEDNLRMGLAYKSGARRFRRICTSCSRCSSRCCTAAAATCPAASSSSWPLPARWRLRRGC
jgi:ABC-type branched-subunit amino acid transport system ATPase component